MAEQNSELPNSAVAVWQAYQAMDASKQRHFEYLQHLEHKYERYGQPSSAEKTQLEQLLKQHDAQVSAFKSALVKIKVSDPSAYASIIQKLAQQV